MYIDGKLEAENKSTATKELFDNDTPLRIGQDFNEDATRFLSESLMKWPFLIAL